METLSKITIKQPLFFSFPNNPTSHFQKPNSISFSNPSFSINSSKTPKSISNPNPNPKTPILLIPQNPFSYFQKPISIPSSKSSFSINLSETPKSISSNPNPKTLSPFSFLKTPLTIAVVATTVFLTGLAYKPKPVFAETRTATLEEQSTTDGIVDSEKESKLEEYVAENPNDVQGLKSLMEIYIRNKKLPKAVDVLTQLIEIEPDEKEWLLLRGHMYSYMDETELSRSAFEEILAKDPLRVEAYHGLVMAVSQGESGGPELDAVVTRINEVIEKCKKEKKSEEVRDFRLLIAQIRVIEGNYDEALRVYEDLVKEEPRDFRPYLCQGIIYTLLKKTDEATKKFDKYRKLVPQGHPYAQYFDDNMLATKVFSQMAENERVKMGDKS